MLLIFIVLVSLSIPCTTLALDPKDYIPAPPGTNVAVCYYDYLSGTDAYQNGHKVSDSADFNGNVSILRYCHWNRFKGISFAFSALLPVGKLALDNAGPDGQEISTFEVSDPVIVFVVWPFVNSRTKTWLGFGQYITAPMGQYSRNKPPGLQLAQNQWAFKEELAFIQIVGPFEWDLSGFVQFYTNNTDYTTSNLTLKKDPLYNIETHLIWDISKSFSMSADYFYQNGGETSVSGTRNIDKLDDHTAGVSVCWQITPTTSFMLKFRDTFKTENGITVKDIGTRICYFF